MLKRSFTATALALSLGFAAATNAQDTEPKLQEMFNSDASSSQFDILDASTWVSSVKNIPGMVPESKPSNWNSWKMSTWTLEEFMKPAPVPKFELARPSGWAVFMKPSSYAGMMNPAMESQFMLPEFWVQFVNPVNWISWVNPVEYVDFINPLTYLQWMNPAAYKDFMNPVNYMQPANPVNYLVYMNPKTYLEWFNGEAYSLKGMMSMTDHPVDIMNASTWTDSVATTYDPFNPSSWLGN